MIEILVFLSCITDKVVWFSGLVVGWKTGNLGIQLSIHPLITVKG